MALNSIAKTAEAEALDAQMRAVQDAAKTVNVNPVAAPADPITIEQATALASALRPAAGGSNPVAEVQAKLRAAMAAAPKSSTMQDAAFVTLLATACTFMVAFGIALGIVCVLFGAAMFLFPVSAGAALGAFVLGAGALFYFMYTNGVKQQSAPPSEMLEPLAAGRFSAA